MRSKLIRFRNPAPIQNIYQFHAPLLTISKGLMSVKFLISNVIKQLYQVNFLFIRNPKNIRKNYGKEGFWTWAFHNFKEHAVSDHRDDTTHWKGGHRDVTSQ